MLALKGSGEATRYSVEDNGSATAAVSAKTQRLRLAAEARRTWALTDGGTLTPAPEVGALWDGGDGETGAGMELGGGLEWVSGALSVAARGRALVAHEGDVEEWRRVEIGAALARVRRPQLVVGAVAALGGVGERPRAARGCGTKGWRAALRRAALTPPPLPKDVGEIKF